MKKKSMLISLLTGILCISLIAGCGGGGRADSKYEGKYVSVVGEAYGMALTGEDIAGFSLELMSGGKAKMTIDGDTESAKWTNDDTNITLTISGTDVVGEIGTDTIKFVNLLDTIASFDCFPVISPLESMLNNTTSVGIVEANFISARTIGSVIFLSSTK